MIHTHAVKRGELFTLLGTLTVDGVVTSNASCVITSKVRSKNSDAIGYALTYQSLETDEASKGKFKLTLNTATLPITQYSGDVKYVLPDGRTAFGDSFNIELTDPATRT